LAAEGKETPKVETRRGGRGEGHGGGKRVPRENLSQPPNPKRLSRRNSNSNQEAVLNGGSFEATNRIATKV